MAQVAFVLDDDPDDAQLVAWTTTPWTLPSNLALCVNPDFEYVKVGSPTIVVSAMADCMFPGPANTGSAQSAIEARLQPIGLVTCYHCLVCDT